QPVVLYPRSSSTPIPWRYVSALVPAESYPSIMSSIRLGLIGSLPKYVVVPPDTRFRRRPSAEYAYVVVADEVVTEVRRFSMSYAYVVVTEPVTLVFSLPFLSYVYVVVAPPAAAALRSWSSFPYVYVVTTRDPPTL